MKNAHWRTIAILITLCLSAVFFSEMPISEKDSSWGHNVLRNWDAIGFMKLGGQLITNPGGVVSDGQLTVYGGHRPYGLYFPFIIGKVAGGFGGDGIAFYLAFSAVVAFAAYSFLADRATAFTGALLVLMCPGYLRMAVVVDTLTVPVLLGLAFLAPLCRRFQDPRPIGFGLGALMALIIAAYAVLNWTTAFVFLIVGLYLIARIGPFNRRLVLFSLAAIAAIAAVGIVSIASKLHGESSGGGARFYDLYNSYLWGAGGYAGYPMNWKTAIVRLGAANLLGLFPILVFFIWTLVRHRKPAGRLPKMLLPLAGAVISVAFMRNYFAHHPWMASPVFIVGAFFSLGLMCQQSDAGPTPDEPAQPGRRELLWMLGAAVYCYMVIAFFQVNSYDRDSLITLVKQNTPRSSLILLSESAYTSINRPIERLEEDFDRTLIRQKDEPQTGLAGAANSPAFILSNEKLSLLGTPLAQTSDHKNPLTDAISAVLVLYRTHIAKRSALDRLDLNDTYYLYAHSLVSTTGHP